MMQSQQNSVNELIVLLKDSVVDPFNPKILDDVVSCYKDIVGEESNIKVIFLAALSRKLPKSLRIHIVNQSRSGAGKSWITRLVLKPFWRDVITLTKFTEPWLSRSSNTLEEKIFFLQDLSRRDDQGKGTIGQIRIMLSDEGISYAFVENTGNGFEPRQIQSKALPVLITTTTNQLNNEDARRFFFLSADEGDQQTIKIIRHNLQKSSSIRFQHEIENGYKKLDYLVRLYEKLAEEVTDVLIPFADKIEDILPQNFQMRTDINKLLQLIKLVTFAHMLNRKVVIKKTEYYDEKYLIADVVDLDEALEIAGKIFTQTNYRMPQGSITLLETLKSLCNSREINSDLDLPTIKECINELDIPRSTLYSYLNPLKDNWFVDAIRLEGSKEYHLRLTEKTVDDFSIKQINYSQDDLDEWFKSEFNDGARLIDVNEYFNAPTDT